MIETERLILRDMKESDADAFLEIFSDPEAMKYFGVIFDRDRMEKWVEDNLAHQEEYGFSLMTVTLRENSRIIGDCGLETTDIEGVNTVGIGFDFIRQYWNQGFATEAGKAVLEYGFRTFGFDKISAWIDPRNEASKRVAEKIGMSLEKTVLRGKKEYSIYSISNPIRL